MGPLRSRRFRRGPGAPAAAVTAGVAVCVALAACSPSSDEPTSPSSSGRTGASSAVAGIAVGHETVSVVAAGDIARRPQDGQGTADLVGRIAPDAVLALGDNAYEEGTAEEYLENYAPTWGVFRAITRPIPGNHEYRTPAAAAYFDYFDDQVHGQPYYAWDAGRWRMYALNCGVDCGRGSEQLAWLRGDLADHPGRPALAYVHEPLFTCSSRHPPLKRLDDVWTALDDAGGALVLSGNNHAYERFATQDAAGTPTTGGMRQFVVGTGGVALYPLVEPCPGREAGYDTTAGVLHLELGPQGYGWRFVAVDGTVLDAGEQRLP